MSKRKPRKSAKKPKYTFDRMLVDGDILIYSVCSAVEYVARFDDDTDVVFGNTKEALAICEETLENWSKKLNAARPVIAFTGAENFRKDVYPDYKSHRKSCRKPCGYKSIKSMLQDRFDVLVEPRLEGDDILGLVQTDGRYEKTVIVSSDKDLTSVPGWLWNPDKDEEAREITTEDANRMFLSQVLTGDKTDGYPGLEGVGPVTAAKILKQGTWDEVVGAYEKAGFTVEYALTQARCARILRSGEYRWDTKEIKLWTP